MAAIIMKHRVADYNTWKKAFDEDQDRRTAAGIRELAVGKSQDDAGVAYVIADLADASVMGLMMEDKELQQRMQDAGVQGPPEIVILN